MELFDAWVVVPSVSVSLCPGRRIGKETMSIHQRLSSGHINNIVASLAF